MNNLNSLFNPFFYTFSFETIFLLFLKKPLNLNSNQSLSLALTTIINSNGKLR